MQEPIIKLNGWKTIKDYAKEKQVTTNCISKLVKLNKIDWREYPELNGLKLVKERANDRADTPQRGTSEE
ncbi:hypothetical protein Q4E40_02500 [Pontibacter sp. BT731]|uniref:hypothetical protein n=1 Tax=Pontibacter coccineus TaxID=3063328 RepID=UPI0026E41DA8|nr:hypothetical protein [Pontibacter sp. BT731]MDO6388982.1 hypothetical protein [Pontibacter sp. BT731]